jgi:hypothetical protein
MCKNTDLHLKTRTVTVKKCFQELPQVLCWCKKKGFCEDTGILGFLIGSSTGRSTNELFSLIRVFSQFSLLLFARQ